MLQQLFRHLCARRPLAIGCMIIGSLLFVLASALQQAAAGSVPLLLLSIVLMVLGVAGQMLGLLALMRGGKR
ncbi:hypothetical protein ACG97_00155 [Vogesella sp. EB]|jgi:hypothetical protein|uniref:Uncharacterized protein n=1 Tax=Vogesella indigofera TaxID=45465 RepID=A0A495BKI8_VOGIN|nr:MULTISPECIES: hypothetical protein [Vogesella]KMJ54738.1 hypothetical protein ACG97_00155 [Vogesella sp. EB]RKQ61112.1 hypothetical protein C8E02_0879 [Vogesella indigofera]